MGIIDFMGFGGGFAIGSVAALILTVLVLIFVMPENRRANNQGFLKKVGDLLSLDYLMIERITTAVYIFITLSCIVGGFFSIFSIGLSGLLIMLLGPIVTRLVYELLMLFVILTRNIMQINGTLKAASGKKTKEASEPRQATRTFTRDDFSAAATAVKNAVSRAGAHVAPSCGTTADHSFFDPQMDV